MTDQLWSKLKVGDRLQPIGGRARAALPPVTVTKILGGPSMAYMVVQAGVNQPFSVNVLRRGHFQLVSEQLEMELPAGRDRWARVATKRGNL